MKIAKSEFENFNTAMDAILRADPKAVKASIDAESQAHAEERIQRGENKRGRKPGLRKSSRINELVLRSDQVSQAISQALHAASDALRAPLGVASQKDSASLDEG